jgi:ABC-type enterochelin transport system permease subunit
MWDKLNKISVQVIVAVISISASFGLLYFLVFKEVPVGNRDLFNVLVGVVCGSTVSSVTGWLYSQSKSNPRQDNKL